MGCKKILTCKFIYVKFDTELPTHFQMKKGLDFMNRRLGSLRTLAEIEEKSKREHQELLAKLDAKIEEYRTKSDEYRARAEADRKEANEILAAAYRESEARLAADRKETAERLAEDSRRAEERLAADRKEAEARQRATEERLAQERNDWDKVVKSHTKWLVATFVTVLIGVAGFFVALLQANGYLPF